MSAQEFFQLFKDVLAEKQAGMDKIQRMVNELVAELEQNDDEEDEDEDEDDILSQLGL